MQIEAAAGYKESAGGDIVAGAEHTEFDLMDKASASVVGCSEQHIVYTGILETGSAVVVEYTSVVFADEAEVVVFPVADRYFVAAGIQGGIAAAVPGNIQNCGPW